MYSWAQWHSLELKTEILRESHTWLRQPLIAKHDGLLNKEAKNEKKKL